jgi:hypothetical protein
MLRLHRRRRETSTLGLVMWAGHPLCICFFFAVEDREMLSAASLRNLKLEISLFTDTYAGHILDCW